LLFLFQYYNGGMISMTPDNPPNDRQRNHRLREDLTRRRDALYERIGAFRRDQSEEMLSTPGDVMDVAKSSSDVDTHASIIETLEHQLAEIDDALNRVDEAQYGFCMNCGDEIPSERLRAVPSAIYCVDCQATIGAGGGSSRAAQREAYARWTPPPEADEGEALTDKGVSPMDELSMRRQSDKENIGSERSRSKKSGVKRRSRNREERNNK
jgi:RNA polymerase-binding transcription factor